MTDLEHAFLDLRLAVDQLMIATRDQHNALRRLNDAKAEYEAVVDRLKTLAAPEPKP